MILNSTWQLYFENLETNEVSNSNLALFANATVVNEDFQGSDAIRCLTEDEDVVIMTVAPVTKNIKILHSPANLGGTRVRPDNKLVAMDGFGSTSTPVLLDESGMTSFVDLRTPSINNLTNLSSEEELRNSSNPNTGRKNFHHMTFVILPPFIAHHIITLDSREPETIFIRCKDLMLAYDERHAETVGFKKSIDECKNILAFLWSAAKGLIPATIFVTRGDDAETGKWNKRRHTNCIGQPSSQATSNTVSGVNDEIIQNLTHSIDNQTILFESLRQEKTGRKRGESKQVWRST